MFNLTLLKNVFLYFDFQKADIEKKLVANTKSLHETERGKVELENKIRELSSENSVVREKFQQSSAVQSEELENLKRDKELFDMEVQVSTRENLYFVCYSIWFGRFWKKVLRMQQERKIKSVKNWIKSCKKNWSWICRLKNFLRKYGNWMRELLHVSFKIYNYKLNL